AGVGHAGWVFDQRLDGAKADGELEQFSLLDESFCRGEVAFHFKGEHAAERAVHLLGGDGVAGVGLEAWVQHPAYARVLVQPICESLGGATLLADPQLERLYAARAKEGVKRAKDCTGCILNEIEALEKCLVANYQG